MSRGIYIGRFQPFHLGHASAIKQALNQVDQLVIGIGSSQYQSTPQNPYSEALRRQMIEGWIKREKLEDRCQIIAIPDIHNAEKWVEHVQSLTPTFDGVFVGSDGLVKALFEAAKIPVQIVKVEHPFSATQIRKYLKNKDDAWQAMIPQSTLEVLKSNPLDLNAYS